MQLTHLHPAFDALQRLHGAENLNSIYGAGCTTRPDLCFIFMNPTGRNIASDKSWTGLKAPWINTKHVWKLFHAVHLISTETFTEIQNRKTDAWTPEFARTVYAELSANKIYVTNLGKCTQLRATPVSNTVFRAYLPLLDTEISTIAPKKIMTFGNQVSSLFLGRSIKVSDMRKQSLPKQIGTQTFPVFPIYYPVGQGMRNLPLAIEDILFAIKS
ncbi:MAG TPA: hypothetical protein DCW68_07170 [Rhodospirillaceae bacterium]|nr:MAG: hypothetical protein A2018_06680 [Alphaproteobacteria bacterium GWF2_58_20]HAU29868.1 hypothetical protein [Rhodospirillaceae bacterium]